MIVRLVTDTDLPGAFIVQAQNETEEMVLRNFCNWPASTERPHRLFMANAGGNPYSFMFHWRPEKDFLKPE